MPVGYMICGGSAGLLAGGLALLAGMGGFWAVGAYAVIGAMAIGLVTLRV